MSKKLENFILEKLLIFVNFSIVFFLILPLSFFCDILTRLRNRFFGTLQLGPRAHDRKVKALQKQIRRWIDEGRTKKLCNARPAWQMAGYRMAEYKAYMEGINTNSLKDILEVDTTNRFVRVEPMVTVAQLLDCLLPLGYTLPLVPPFDDLTIGGLINGCGLAASGRKYGLFQHICISYDILLPDGSVVNASKRTTEGGENHALFYGVPWSHGTLGFIVSATIRIVPFKPFIKLTYIPCDSIESVGDLLREEAGNRDNEFVDAIIYSRELGVVMKGVFSDAAPKNQTYNPIGRWYKSVFYERVKEIAENGKTIVEHIPIRQYYQRYGRTIFWGLKYCLPFSSSIVFRYLFGWLLPPRRSFLKLLVAKMGPLRRLLDRRFVFQDFLIAAVNLDETLHLLHEQLEVYPLWLCPFNLPSTPGILRQRSGRNIMHVDVAVLGRSQKSDDEFMPRKAVEQIEEFLRAVSGMKMLYADNCMDRAQFWEMFDSSLYDWLRVKYGSRNSLPDVFEKTSLSARY